MIRAIIFDCFGVLTGDTWKEFTATLGDNVKSDVRNAHGAYDRGLISYEEFREQASEITGAEPEVFDQIFIQRTGRHKNTTLLAHIKELKSTYKLGILSNVGTAWIREEFLTAEELALFDDMVLSFEVGKSKPDPAIYELACQRLGVEPSEAVFVDDLVPYCQAAEVVGMKTVQYQDFAQYRAAIDLVLADANK